MEELASEPAAKRCQRGMLKPRDFNSSVGAIGGRVLKGPTFFGPGHHSHSTVSTPLSMRRATLFELPREETS
jgi:hypothetical protein